MELCNKRWSYDRIFTLLTSCSCVVVVCVLEPLSATSSWAKATKTERQEQHDESLHARNRICHVCAAQRCWSALEPCLSTTSKDRIFACKWLISLAQCHECHACHAKRRWMWVCATPATQTDSRCEFVPRLPRKVPRRHGRPSQSKRATQCHLSHACHAKRRWMWVCATPATQTDSRCEFVPRLPRKVPRRHRRPSQSKRATQCHECHACHAKRR